MKIHVFIQLPKKKKNLIVSPLETDMLDLFRWTLWDELYIKHPPMFTAIDKI